MATTLGIPRDVLCPTRPLRPVADYKCLCETSGWYTATEGGDCDDGNALQNSGLEEDCATDFDDNCELDKRATKIWRGESPCSSCGRSASRCRERPNGNTKRR